MLGVFRYVTGHSLAEGCNDGSGSEDPPRRTKTEMVVAVHYTWSVAIFTWIMSKSLPYTKEGGR